MKDSVTNMIRSNASVKDTATVAEAALEMLKHHAHELPVVDRENRILGIVSADDLYSSHASHISDLIKEPALIVPDDLSTYEAVSRMKEANSLYALVTDGSKFVGMVTWQDVLSEFTHR